MSQAVLLTFLIVRYILRPRAIGAEGSHGASVIHSNRPLSNTGPVITGPMEHRVDYFRVSLPDSGACSVSTVARGARVPQCPFSSRPEGAVCPEAPPYEVGAIAGSSQHFGSASVVTGMDDYMLTTVKMRGEALTREARRDARAAEARRAARPRQTVPAAARRLVPRAARRLVPRAARRLVPRPARWLAMAAAWMRPTATGR
jgi:hypothetical protein